MRSLYPNKPDVEIATNLAAHFNAISSEFDGLQEEAIPIVDDLDLPLLSREDAAKGSKPSESRSQP